MALPKWNEERTQQLVDAVASVEAPIAQTVVSEIANDLETTPRSVASKLRKLGYEVAKVGEKARTYSPEQEAALEAFVTDNSGQFTYGEIAEQFEGGAFTRAQIQGKLLSMELTAHVRPTEPKVAARTYSEEEEATIARLASEGAYMEDIAEAVGRKLASVRGKTLSMLRQGVLEAMPKQREVRETTASDPLAGIDVASMTVAEIAEATDKSERGVKSMLTRRGIACANYDGAAKQAKRQSSAGDE